MSRRAGLGLLGAAALISILTLVSRAVGFGRTMVQAWAMGRTATADAYTNANVLPNILFEIAAGGALAGAVIPLLAAPLAKHIKGDVNRISSALLTWTLTALIPLAALVALLAPTVLSLTSSDVDPQTFALGVTLLQIFAIQIPLYGVGVVLTGVLQAHKRFVWPAIAPILSSTVVIGSYVVFRMLADGNQGDPSQLSAAAVAWLGWGTTAGVVAMSLPQFIPVLRLGVRLRWTWHFPPGVAPRARSLALAGVGAVVAQQVATAVIAKVANWAGTDGTFPVFNYTQAVYVLPYAVLAVPLATSTFPRLADALAGGDRASYARMVSIVTRGVLAVSIAGVAMLIAAAPAVEQVFEVVARSAGGVSGMTGALTWMAPGLVGYALIFHLSRALYALDRGRAAVIATSAGWLTVIIVMVAVAAATYTGHPSDTRALQAIGIGLSVGMTVAGIGLLLIMRHIAGAASLARVPLTAVCGIAAAIVAAVLGRLLTSWLLPVGGGLVWGVCAGAAGAVVAAAGVLAAVVVFDRTLVGELRRLERAKSNVEVEDA